MLYALTEWRSHTMKFLAKAVAHSTEKPKLETPLGEGAIPRRQALTSDAIRLTITAGGGICWRQLSTTLQ